MGIQEIKIKISDENLKHYSRFARDHGKTVEELFQNILSAQYPLLFDSSKEDHLLIYDEGNWVSIDLEKGIVESLNESKGLYTEQSILSVLEEN